MIQNVKLTKEKLSPQPSTCLGIYLCPHDVSAFELPQTLKLCLEGRSEIAQVLSISLKSSEDKWELALVLTFPAKLGLLLVTGQPADLCPMPVFFLVVTETTHGMNPSTNPANPRAFALGIREMQSTICQKRIIFHISGKVHFSFT